MTIFIADTETNGIHNPSIIWVLGILDYETNEYTSYTGDQIPDGLLRLAEADVIIGHNWRKYDAIHITRLTDGLITFPDEKVVDTLELSRKLVRMNSHSLDTWGEFFQLPKIKDTIPGFDVFHPNMVPYCQRDCEITTRVFSLLTEMHNEKYGVPF